MSNRTWQASLPTLARIAALLCCLLTVGAVIRMNVVTFPDHPVPEFVVRLDAPGMTSLEMDESITLPVEAAVRSLDGSGKIVAESRAGQATITVETTGMVSADFKERLEQTLNEVTAQLPVREWSVSQENLEDSRIGYFLLHGTDVQTLADVARYTVYEKLISLPGVARLDIEEEVARQEVELVFRPSILQAYGLTPADVLEQLPRDTAAEEVGVVGRGQDQTTVQWLSQTEGPQELGQRMIQTEKGYVSLKTLAEIRDLRGSKGEEVPVYQGEPALGITVFAAESAQLPQVRKQVLEAVDELNRSAQGSYRIDLFADYGAVLTETISQMAVLAIMAAAICAVLIGWIQKRKTAAILSGGAVVLAAGALLGGMWLAQIPLSLSTLGPLVIFILLYIGAGPALFMRLGRLPEKTPGTCLRQVWQLMRPLLLTILILTAGWYALVATDYLEASDRSLLLDAWPVFLAGTVALLLVYGFLVPVMAGTWLSDKQASAAEKAVRPVGKGRRIAGSRLLAWWERSVKKGYLPYTILLAVSLVCGLLLHPFLVVDPYEMTSSAKKSLHLEMVRGSGMDDAIRAAQIAEERLRAIDEVRDVYTTATRERLTFHLLLHDISDWTQSQYDLEKELDRSLREIPGTDPFALVVNDEQRLRLEFTVQGPARQKTEEIARQVLALLADIKSTDENGREVITDERIGEGRTGTYLQIRPRQEMLLRYRVTEADIKRQLASYLGEQEVGSTLWNGRKAAVQARFPEAWMEHEDQVKNILIRTPAGTVRLIDLVDWSYGTEPPVYKREDGMYVFQVSSAVSNPSRIDTLSYALPLRMKEQSTLPEGYMVLNADEWEKLTEEKAEQTDSSGRFVTVAGLAVFIVLASVLLRARLRDGLIAIALLPLMAGVVIIGLMATDRPMNLIGFYGIAAAIVIMVQQALIYLDEIAQEPKNRDLWQRLSSGSAKAIASQVCVFASITIASLPLVPGWLGAGGYVGSFASALFSGMLLAAYSAMVLVPGMQYATEQRQERRAEITLPLLLQNIRLWWENEKVRRQDRRSRRKALGGQDREDERMEMPAVPFKSPDKLSPEDFLPLSEAKHDRMQP